MKNTILYLLLAATSLSACSSQEPETIVITENLRKVNSSIQGTWTISGSNGCDSTKIDATKIYILENKILAGNNTKQQPLMSEIRTFKSEAYVVLAGVYHPSGDTNERQLAFYDHGDQLRFAGYIVDNNLVDRKTILKQYNHDNSAALGMATMDFTYCNSDLLQEDNTNAAS